jgi:tetratricopeptide (TPR) repeat protein
LPSLRKPRIIAAMRLLAAAAFLALALAGGAAADQNDPRLDGLFARLRATQSPLEARALESLIWDAWLFTEDDDVRLLVRQGTALMEQGQLALALAAFNGVVERAPRFAEGWNKRATVFFLMDDYDSSLADIERTLALEPRHFGALSGLGQIYLGLDRKSLALKAFEAALKVDPHLAGARAAVEALKKALEGDPT